MYRQARLHTRVKKRFPATIEFYPKGALKVTRLAAVTQDVSRSGCGSLLSPIELDVKSRITVSISIPASEGLGSTHAFKSPAVVRWVKRQSDKEYLVGVEFVDMPKTQLEPWNDLIHRWTTGEL